MGLYQNMLYCPIPGLVALFARASLLPRNPRAPLTLSRAAIGLSYTAVVMQLVDNSGVAGGSVTSSEQGARQQARYQGKERCLGARISCR
jgi:hypothetical protein